MYLSFEELNTLKFYEVLRYSYDINLVEIIFLSTLKILY